MSAIFFISWPARGRLNFLVYIYIYIYLLIYAFSYLVYDILQVDIYSDNVCYIHGNASICIHIYKYVCMSYFVSFLQFVVLGCTLSCEMLAVLVCEDVGFRSRGTCLVILRVGHGISDTRNERSLVIENALCIPYAPHCRGKTT